MATSQTLPVPETPNMAAVSRSLAGLKAMGGDDARMKIAAIDQAWDASNNSVVATARDTGMSYKDTLRNLSRGPVNRIAQDDPRVMAYTIALSDVSEGRRDPNQDARFDDATRAAQERSAMKRLARNPDDEQGMTNLVGIAHGEIVRDLTRTRQANKAAKDNDAR